MNNPQKTVQETPLPTVLSNLSNLLDDRPESFASGNGELQLAALQATKYMFEHALTTESQSRPHIVQLLSSLHPEEAPQTRSQTKTNGKRKRDPVLIPAFQETPLSSLHVENVDPEQVWAQLELRAQGVCEMLQKALEGASEAMEEEDDDEGKSVKKSRFSDLTPEDLEQLGIDAETLEALAAEQGDNLEEEDDDDDSEESNGEEEESDGEDIDLGEGIAQLRDHESEPPLKSVLSRNPKSKKGSYSKLDDGFFDLASFNAETEEAEAKHVSGGRLGSNLEDEDDSESDVDSVDYFAAVNGVEAFETGGPTESEAYYKEFFDPPSSSSSKQPKSSPKSKTSKVRFHEEVKVKNIKAKGKSLPVNSTFQWEEEDDGEESLVSADDMLVDGEGDEEIGNLRSDDDREDDEDDEEEEDLGGGRDAIDRLKGDLFDDDEEQEIDTTTHQKRMASLQDQISTLEQENIAPKSWTLMGEAQARGRPQNSLLEEDLEFERVMKAVPMVTEDVVQELEARIKARILDNHFDDVVRRRPLDDKPFLPSRMFQLQDAKSTQSLAEIYEGEFVAAQTGAVTGEDRDGKLKKEHNEIEQLWETISTKLDALCNAHFIPKQPKATIVNISDTAAATMESALPASLTASTMLAPEEILTPSSANGPQDRSELNPGQKRALRGKERKMRKRTRDQLTKSVDKFSAKAKSVKKQKEEALRKVVKSGKGVTVVGKKNQDVLRNGKKKV